MFRTMAVEILLPPTGSLMQAGRITQWLANDGARVVEGQPLFVLEATEPSQSVEAPATGTLHITAAVGKTYEVGTVLGYIE